MLFFSFIELVYGEDVHIDKQYTADELVLHPKTSHSNRDAYLFKTLTLVLLDHISHLPVDSTLLFPNKSGGYN